VPSVAEFIQHSTRRPPHQRAAVHDEGQMPFGGTKASGYGRFGGKAAIDEFTELLWIPIQTGPHPYPF
jgi:acyl-CoA reductase-like NAD-dependent aldehyde dehydrogenase